MYEKTDMIYRYCLKILSIHMQYRLYVFFLTKGAGTLSRADGWAAERLLLYDPLHQHVYERIKKHQKMHEIKTDRGPAEKAFCLFFIAIR